MLYLSAHRKLLSITISSLIGISAATYSSLGIAQSDQLQEQGVTQNNQVGKLKAVKVTATVDGAADSGYVSENATTTGPWDGRDLLNTPYSVNVIPQELIENLQSTTTDQIFKLNPVTQMSWPQAQNDNPHVFMRGFEASTFARDGITRPPFNYSHGTTMEEIERMEVFTGLSGFMYGAGNVGGLVNFVTKRPTEERLNSFTLGNSGGQNYYLHGDLGGQIDSDGQFGYRINAVTQDGETAVDNQNLKRNFISAAFDWQASDNLILELNAAKRDYELEGRQIWALDNGVDRPDPETLDPTKNWAQKWAGQDVESQRIGVSALWSVSDRINVRAGYLDEYNTRSYIDAYNILQGDNRYYQEIAASAPQKINGNGGYLFTDFSFGTGSIEHKLTVGGQLSESIWDLHPDGWSDSIYFNDLTLDAPTYFPKPVLSAHGTLPTFSTLDQRTRTLTVGDDIKFNEQWSALVGISQGQIMYQAHNAAGLKTADYDKKEITPTASLIYKPMNNLTTYISYMEGLEQGGVAGRTFGALTVVNATEVMEPLVSEQIEIGVKANVGDVLLTAALFSIDKPFEYYQALNATEARFVQDGRRVHEGLEFTATGKITENFTLVGGFTLLDASVEKNAQNPQLEGKRPMNVAEQMYKVYGEYALPGLGGLTLTGGISRTGNRYGDSLNNDALGSYTLADLGARYVLDLQVPVTLRLNVNNLTDERYWANDSFVGDARTVIFSANIQL